MACSGHVKSNAPTTFSERVVLCALKVPKGAVTTYGRIAKAAGGGAMAAQSVTLILSAAEKKGVADIPFHRIVYADGRAWCSPRRRAERLALYAKEGIVLNARDRVANFSDILFEFT